MTELTPAAEPREQDRGRRPEPGTALCLSGGGYRAMLFHVGALWRLNETGYLAELERVSSVSGGSITAGVLALAWPKLAFDANGVAQGFEGEVVEPLRRLAGKTIDFPAIAIGLITPGVTIGERIAAAYKKHLFGGATLQDLPDRPRFVFNATNLQSGVLWRFAKPYMRDYRVGEVKGPQVEVATAVAASSAFPPFLSPVVLKLDEAAYTTGSGELQRAPFTTRPFLTDGGVYDNLGLETIWERYETILISDGGGHMREQEKPKRLWPLHAFRVLGVIDSQVRALRKRSAIAEFRAGRQKGTYWGIWTNIADYGLPSALPCPHDVTLRVAATPTRLGKMDAGVQERLINWGYAVCDAALRRHVDPGLPADGAFPYPAAGVGTEPT
jgi:NTE family protein